MTNKGQIQKLDELTLIYVENKVFVNSDECVLPVSCLDLSVEVEKFKDGIAWRVRVLNYDEESCELMTEIMDYHAHPEMNSGTQISLQFLIIEKIRFRSIDTANLLNAVELKKKANIQRTADPVIDYNTSDTSAKLFAKPIERTTVKIMKVPFHEVQFLHASVSFKVFIDEFQKEINFEIENPHIRPEFEVVKDYFVRIFKKKLIIVEIEIHYLENEFISAIAKSEDINKINNSIIDSVRFEFIKKEIFGFKRKKETLSILNTLDNLLEEKKLVGKILIRTGIN